MSSHSKPSKHITSDKGTLDLLEYKDYQLKLAEEQNLMYLSEIQRQSHYIDMIESQLDTAMQAFNSEKEESGKLARGLNKAISKMESLSEKLINASKIIESLREQNNVSNIVINDLTHQLNIAEQAKVDWKIVSRYDYLDPRWNVVEADEEREAYRKEADQLYSKDDVERPPRIMITKGKYTFEAVVNVDNEDLPLGECSYCLNDFRRLVRSCCSYSICTTCYFRASERGRNGTDIQQYCELCTDIDKKVVEPQNDDEEEDSQYAYDQVIEYVHHPNQSSGSNLIDAINAGTIRTADNNINNMPTRNTQSSSRMGAVINRFEEWEDNTDELILDSYVTRFMWLTVTNAIKHGSKTLEDVQRACRSDMSKAEVIDTLTLMLEERRITMEGGKIEFAWG